jgi:hypothetical protein
MYRQVSDCEQVHHGNDLEGGRGMVERMKTFADGNTPSMATDG